MSHIVVEDVGLLVNDRLRSIGLKGQGRQLEGLRAGRRGTHRACGPPPVKLTRPALTAQHTAHPGTRLRALASWSLTANACCERSTVASAPRSKAERALMASEGRFPVRVVPSQRVTLHTRAAHLSHFVLSHQAKHIANRCKLEGSL